MVAEREMKIFSLNSNRPLAEKIAQTVGIPLSNVGVNHFADGEIQIEINESVRGADVYVIQSGSRPVNENFMELMIMIDALRRASAASITVVLPYFGYARADHKNRSREPITAKMIANMIEMDGAARVVTLDLHAAQIEGFFDIPVDNLRAMPLLARYFLENHLIENTVVVSPDHTSVKDARKLAEMLHLPIAITDYIDGEMDVIGDVKDQNAIIIDDMIDTGKRMSATAEVLKAHGAREISVAATHAVFSEGIVDKLTIPAIKRVVITDSIKIAPENQVDKLIQISVGPLIGKAISNIHDNKSVGSIFTAEEQEIEKFYQN